MTTVLIAGETALEEGVNSKDAAAVVDAVANAPTKAELQKGLPQLWT